MFKIFVPLLFCVLCAVHEGVSNGLTKTTKVVNGRKARQDEVPYMAVILIHSDVVCGGSVYNDRHVITAAHCFDDAPRTEEVKVASAINDVEDILWGDFRQIKAHKIKSYTIHPKYDRKTALNDIAIVELLDQNETLLKGKVVPIPLPPQGHTFKGVGVGPTPASSFCAGLYPEGGTGVCQGDSGGALVCKEKIAPSEKPKSYLCGIASMAWGCELAVPDTFTEASQFTNWVQEVAGPQP